MVKALALGADAVALASASLMALGCQQYRMCGSGQCPMGIATQDTDLRAHFDWDAAVQRVENYYRATFDDVRMFCRIMGHKTSRDFSMDDLVTFHADLAERCGIARA